jgi:N-acetylglucosamine-6-phosphate deacetylase
VTLVECVTNLLRWTRIPVATGLKTVTSTPAKWLGLGQVKGCLDPGADADLVVLGEGKDDEGLWTLTVDEVWKFGKRVHRRPSGASGSGTPKL